MKLEKLHDIKVNVDPLRTIFMITYYSHIKALHPTAEIMKDEHMSLMSLELQKLQSIC